MEKLRFKKFIGILIAQKSKAIGLVISYILGTEVLFKLPYFNVYTLDFQWRIFIFFLLLIAWFRPSVKFLIFASILFLILGKLGEITGILIYVSLLSVAIGLLIEGRSNKGNEF